jgi:tetratricopeptide (TPR) repeat protein
MFNSILKHNPIDDLIWRYKGETLAKLGNFTEAINCYDKAIEILPDYMAETLWVLKGKALSKCSEFDKAVECFNQVLKINPDSEIAEKEKQKTKKLKEKNLNDTEKEKEIEALTMRVNDAYDSHLKLLNMGIQSDILHKTLYDAMRNENFKEKMIDDLIELAKERVPKKDKPNTHQ